MKKTLALLLVFLFSAQSLVLASSPAQTWTRANLTGTGLSVESPKPYKLLQDKPDVFLEDQTAKVSWSLSYAGVFSTISYEAYKKEKTSPRKKLDETAALFKGMNKSIVSRVTDTIFLGQPGALFEEEFFETYEKKNTRRKMVMFGPAGQLTTVNISFPIGDAAAQKIAERIFASVRKEGSVAAETSKQPATTNWTSLVFHGLTYDTPNPVTATSTECRYSSTKPITGNSADQVCYVWTPGFSLMIDYQKYGSGRVVPNPRQRAENDVVYYKEMDAESTLKDARYEYSYHPIQIAGAEAIRMRRYMFFGLQPSYSDSVYIKRGNETWLVTLIAASRWEFEKEGAARILASFKFSTPIAAIDPKTDYMKAGEALAAKGDHAGAVQQFNMAIAVDAKNGLAYFSRAILNSRLGDREAAIRDYTSAIVYKTSLREAYFNRGTIYYYKSDYIAAIADLDRSLAIDPKYARALFNRALSYWMLKDKEKSLADLTAVIALDPPYTDAYIMRAQILCSQKLILSAIKDEDKAISLGGKVTERCGRSHLSK